jgi:hypothetical protein
MLRKLKTLAAAAVLMIAAQNANAISLRFKFKTFSSGPEIYACNAGLRHASSTHKVCYFENTQKACTPDDESTANTNTRCVCTGVDGGEYLRDYMNGSYDTWAAATGSNEGGVWNSSWTDVNKQSGVASYETLVKHGDAFASRIKELSFNLGSELYGAEYFVDVCYKGPQMEYSEDNIATNFKLSAQASATDFIAKAVNLGDDHPESAGSGKSQDGLTLSPSTIQYTALSGLTVQAVTICDIQSAGTYKTSNVSGDYNTLENEAEFTDWDNAPKGGATSEFNLTSSVATIGSSTSLISNALITDGTDAQAPRFCRVRYIFKETNADATTKNMRKWQRHGAEMTTYTKIEDVK